MSEPSVSVLVPAWQATAYLRPCLDSIYAQRPDGFEVIVGVDGCPVTLDYLRNEKPKRWPSLRILWGRENRGAYVTRNSLARAARGEFFVFFDADDIMLPGLVGWCWTRRDARAVSQFRFVQRIGHGIDARQSMPSSVGARGVFGIRRDSFLALGGFQGWPCSADTEFQRRAAVVLGRPVLSPGPLFVYRRHHRSLTRTAKTGVRSLTRRIYQQKALMVSASPIVAPVAEMEEVWS